MRIVDAAKGARHHKPTHLEKPLLVVAVPDVDHAVTSSSSKGAKHGVVCDSVDREHNIHPLLCVSVALQDRYQHPCRVSNIEFNEACTKISPEGCYARNSCCSQT
jgi:hypothetical protein